MANELHNVTIHQNTIQNSSYSYNSWVNNTYDPYVSWKKSIGRGPWKDSKTISYKQQNFTIYYHFFRTLEDHHSDEESEKLRERMQQDFEKYNEDTLFHNPKLRVSYTNYIGMVTQFNLQYALEDYFFGVVENGSLIFDYNRITSTYNIYKKVIK